MLKMDRINRVRRLKITIQTKSGEEWVLSAGRGPVVNDVACDIEVTPEKSKKDEHSSRQRRRVGFPLATSVGGVREKVSRGARIMDGSIRRKTATASPPPHARY